MSAIGDELLVMLGEVREAEEANKREADSAKFLAKHRAQVRLYNRMGLWPDATRHTRWGSFYMQCIPGAQARYKRQGKELSRHVSAVRRELKQGLADRTLTVADVGIQLGLLKQATQNHTTLTINNARQVRDKAHPALAAYQTQLDKLEKGEWKVVPWGSSIDCETLVHLSETDPTRVAYTQSVEKLMRNTQTITSPGKFLKQRYPEMSDAEIKRWAEITVANAAPWDLNILNNNDPQWEDNSTALENEWERLYAEVSVAYSCMAGKKYVRPYGKPGNHLGLAYLGKDEDLQGRCIIRFDTMEYLRAFPGGNENVNVPLVEGLLEAAGYGRCDDGLEGIQLTRIEGNDRDVMMPYIDGDCQSFDICSDHICICHNGDYEANSQSGEYSGGEDDREQCDECGDSFDDNELTYIEHREARVCEYCLNNNYYYAIIGRNRRGGFEHDHARQDICTYVGGSVGEWVLDDKLEELDMYECEDSDDYYHINDLVSVLNGFCHEDVAVALAFEDCDGNDYAIPCDTTTTVFGNTVLTDDSEKTVGGSIVHREELEAYPLAMLCTPIHGRDFITQDELKENMGGEKSLCLTLGEHDEIDDLFAEINDEMLEELKLWMSTETAIEWGSIKHPNETTTDTEEAQGEPLCTA